MSYCKFKHVNRISPTENVLQMEIKKLKEEMAVMTEWVNSIKDWMQNEIEEVNTELEEQEKLLNLWKLKVLWS